MKEKSLNTIIDFFALIANNSKLAGSQIMTNLVESYLSIHFSTQTLDSQTARYAEKNFAYSNLRNQSESNWDSFFESELEAQCYIITREVQASDRLLVLIYLLEMSPYIFDFSLTNDQSSTTHNETPFFKKLGRLFNFSETDLADCKSFIDGKYSNIVGSNDVLCITGNQYLEIPSVKIQFHPHLMGQMIFLNIKSVNTILFRVNGVSNFEVNGRQIYKRQTNVLTKGAILLIDGLATIYYNDIEKLLSAGRLPDPLIMQANGIDYIFPNGQVGIHELGFTLASGELMAIMGGSGCGKTTLMNILIGFLNPTKGQVIINNVNIHEAPTLIKPFIGYVPQEDALLGELTAFENLYFNASLCLKNKSKEELTQVTDSLLNELGLLEIRNLKVGTSIEKIISGGQRKRLNIAMELIRDPKILFLDEPTTGLSSSDTENIMLLLKKSSLDGKMIILNIHQPSSDIFKLFDKLLFLDHGGYPVYFGRAALVISYLKKSMRVVDWHENECQTCGKQNPEDIFHFVQQNKIDPNGQVMQSRAISPQRWHRSYLRLWYEQDAISLDMRLPNLLLELPNKITQFLIYSKRNLFTKIADKQYLTFALFLSPLLALVLSVFSRYSPSSSFGEYVYGHNDNIPQFLLMSIIVAMFMGMMSSGEEIIKDRGMLKRESFLSLSFFSYILSKVTFLFTLSAIQMGLYIYLSGWVLKLPNQGLTLFPILWATACFANVLGLLISSFLKSAATVYMSIPFLLVPQILLSGAVIDFNKINPYFASAQYTPIVADAMVAKWAYEALMVDLFMQNDYTQQFYPYDKKLNELIYLRDFLGTELENTYYEWDDNGPSHGWEKHQQLLESGLTTLGKYEPLKPIKPCILSNGSVAFMVYMDSCKKILSNEIVATQFIVDSLLIALGPKYIDSLKSNFLNKSVSNFVTGKENIEKIIIRDNQFIRKMAPIYDSTSPGAMRAPLFSAEKHLGKFLIPVKYYNTTVIWLFATILLLTILLIHKYRSR